MKNEWRAGHDNTYSIVLNSAIEDHKITAVAFRVLAYLAGKPNGWDVYNSDVAKKCSISQKRLSKAWKELEDAGWIIREKSTNNNGIDGKCGTYKYTLVDPTKATKCDIEQSVQEKGNVPQSIKTLKERSNNNHTSVKEIHKSIISHFNAVAGTNYRAGSKATIGLINGRIAEGYTLDDFKTVIDKKVHDWGNDPKMSKFIRPATLFSASNFESYLNEISYKKQPKMTDQIVSYGA